MLRPVVTLALGLGALWSAAAFAQSRAQLGPLCTSENTPPDQQIDVRAEVVSVTKNKQVPWSNSSLLGEVYLVEK